MEYFESLGPMFIEKGEEKAYIYIDNIYIDENGKDFWKHLGIAEKF